MYFTKASYNHTKIFTGIVLCLATMNCLEGFEMPPLDASANAKFSTEQLSHGRKKGGKTANAEIKIRTQPSENGGGYYGAAAELIVNGKEALNKVTPFVGMSYPLTDKVKLDCCFSHKFVINFQNKHGDRVAHNTEICCKIAANVLLSPSLQISYDLNDIDLNIEGQISHSFALTNNVSIEPTAKIGYQKANGPKTRPRGTQLAIQRDYFHGGLAANLVYRPNEYSKLSIGPEFTCNSAKKNSWVNVKDGCRSQLWFNASVNFSF